MWEGTESIEIAAPPEVVWAILADVTRHPELAGSGEVKAIRMSGSVGVGASWESDEEVAGMTFVARSECVAFDPPRELSWKSYPPPLEEGRPDSVPDVTWWFRLSPSEGGTRVEHSFRVVEPTAGADAIRSFYEQTDRANVIVRGMLGTLSNLKAAAEAR